MSLPDGIYMGLIFIIISRT